MAVHQKKIGGMHESWINRPGFPNIASKFFLQTVIVLYNFTLPVIMSALTFQEQYARNLSWMSRGIPIYRPLSLREARVGDVAFFHPRTGQYKWIVNAFNTDVSLFEISFWLQELRRRGWPIFSIPESVSVTADESECFRMAIGGSARIIRKEIGLEADTSIMPG